jgi:MFS family permease
VTIPRQSRWSYTNPGYRWYAAGVLTLVYFCHAIDRSLPNILVEPIRHEFNLSDSQLGLFSGVAFGLAFSLAALPMGHISDRVSNRRNLLAGIVVVWSLFTVLGGLTRNFAQLLLVRIGLGAAEAGTAPLIIPMLTDIFPPSRRALALGLLYVSPPLGGFMATAIGGYVAADYGWRTAFFLAGLPGLSAALLLLTTVRNPDRGGSDPDPSTDGVSVAPKAGKLREAIGFLRRNPPLILLIFGCALLGLLNITLGVWMSSFFIRVHHLSLGQTGVILAVAYAASSFTAPPLFGWLADRLAARSPSWGLRVVWLAALGSFVFTMAQLFLSVLSVVIVCYVIGEVLRSGYTPPTYSVLMSRTPAPIRGSVMSIVQLVTAISGFGLGPIITGGLSDLFGGGAAIRYAMAGMTMLFILAAALLILASRGLYGRGAQEQAMMPG